MATCKLSTIITDIAGSVGGVTFRRHGGQTVVSKKSRGPSRATSLGNARLPQMRTLVTNWNALTQTVRDAWATAALNYTFPDKFGVQRHLSGRELYLKLQGNLIVTGQGALDPTTLASAITMGVNPVLRVAMSLASDLLNGFNLTNWYTYGSGVVIDSSTQFTVPSSGGGIRKDNILTIGKSYQIDLIGTTTANLFDIIAFPIFSLYISTVSPLSLSFQFVALDNGLYLRGNGGVTIISSFTISEVIGFNATINFDAVFASTVLIQAEKLKNNAIAATFTRRQIIANKNMNAASLFDFSLELLEKFPDIKQNDLIRIYITYMNSSGFRSVPQVIETTVLE